MRLLLSTKSDNMEMMLMVKMIGFLARSHRGDQEIKIMVRVKSRSSGPPAFGGELF